MSDSWSGTAPLVSWNLIKRRQDRSESIGFLARLAAGHPTESIPDDDHLAALAIEHRMHGLVMSALDSREDSVSDGLRRRLGPVDGQTWARHRFLASELNWVSSRLTDGNVEHYLIKGLAVEGRFYDRIGERPSADLDVVLLPPAPIMTALDLLGGTSPGSHLVDRLAEAGWIQSMDVKLPSAAVVDLHIDPLKLGFRSRFSTTVGRHLESVTVDGTTIRTLDPTASLVVALVHLNRNRFRHLSGFADVTRLLTRSQIDWDAFEDLVLADGLEVLIDGSLSAVRNDLNLDESMVAGWTTRRIGRAFGLRSAVWNVAWRPSTRLSGQKGRFRMGRRSQFLMPALCRGRLAWLIRWMARRLFPPSPLLELNHPGVSGPYLVRLIRGRWNKIHHMWLHRRARTRAE
jgi:hypothetical protein